MSCNAPGGALRDIPKDDCEGQYLHDWAFLAGVSFYPIVINYGSPKPVDNLNCIPCKLLLLCHGEFCVFVVVAFFLLDGISRPVRDTTAWCRNKRITGTSISSIVQARRESRCDKCACNPTPPPLSLQRSTFLLTNDLVGLILAHYWKIMMFSTMNNTDFELYFYFC